MKCQICYRRKAVHLGVSIKWADTPLNICEKCRRLELPTLDERRQDDDAEMHRVERQAEFDACYVELDY